MRNILIIVGLWASCLILVSSQTQLDAGTYYPSGISSSTATCCLPIVMSLLSASTTTTDQTTIVAMLLTSAAGNSTCGGSVSPVPTTINSVNGGKTYTFGALGSRGPILTPLSSTSFKIQAPSGSIGCSSAVTYTIFGPKDYRDILRDAFSAIISIVAIVVLYFLIKKKHIREAIVLVLTLIATFFAPPTQTRIRSNNIGSETYLPASGITGSANCCLPNSIVIKSKFENSYSAIYTFGSSVTAAACGHPNNNPALPPTSLDRSSNPSSSHYVFGSWINGPTLLWTSTNSFIVQVPTSTSGTLSCPNAVKYVPVPTAGTYIPSLTSLPSSNQTSCCLPSSFIFPNITTMSSSISNAVFTILPGATAPLCGNLNNIPSTPPSSLSTDNNGATYTLGTWINGPIIVPVSSISFAIIPATPIYGSEATCTSVVTYNNILWKQDDKEIDFIPLIKCLADCLELLMKDPEKGTELQYIFLVNGFKGSQLQKQVHTFKTQQHHH